MNNKEKTQKIKKILLFIVLASILLFIPLKMLAKTEKNSISYVGNKNVFVDKTFLANTSVDQGDQTKLMQKIWDTLLELKKDKKIIYEFKRKLEKQDVLSLMMNKQNFVDIVKSLPYNDDQKKFITDSFSNIDIFAESLYTFYLYLILAQLDEKTIDDLKKQSEFIKGKIYKIDPVVVEKLKNEINQKNDPSLSQAIKEIDKNLYQNNLDENKMNILLSELNKINYILRNYEEIKNSSTFLWIKEKKQDILDSLKIR